MQLTSQLPTILMVLGSLIFISTSWIYAKSIPQHSHDNLRYRRCHSDVEETEDEMFTRSIACFPETITVPSDSILSDANRVKTVFYNFICVSYLFICR